MSTGLLASGGSDLDTLFEPRGSLTKRADVGFVVEGSDISNRFASVDYGSQIANATGFKNGGNDLKALFAGLGTTEAVKTFSSTEGDSYDMGTFIAANPGRNSYRFVVEGGVTQPRLYYEGAAVNITIENHGTIVGHRSTRTDRSTFTESNAAIHVYFISGAGKSLTIYNYGTIQGGGGAGGFGGTSPASTYTYWTPNGGNGAGWDSSSHTMELGQAGVNGETGAGGTGGTGHTNPGGAGGDGVITLSGNTAGGGGGGGFYGAAGGAGGSAYVDGGSTLVEAGTPGRPGAYAIHLYNGTVPYSTPEVGTIYGGIGTGLYENN